MLYRCIYICVSFIVAVHAAIEISRQTDKILCSIVITIPLPTWHTCIELCSRMTVCKSANFITSSRTCQLNDRIPDGGSALLKDSPGASFIAKSDSLKNLAGLCVNNNCQVNEVCIEGTFSYICVPLYGFLEIDCKTDWLRFKGRCYFYGQTSLSWNDAQDDCLERGSNLVKVEDECEQQWLATVIPGRYTWIGANDIAVEGQWKWISDDTDVGGHFSAWSPKEPSDNVGNENCVGLWDSTGREWNDASCWSTYPYICKM